MPQRFTAAMTIQEFLNALGDLALEIQDLTTLTTYIKQVMSSEGNSYTATTLQTPRTIDGVSFNGSSAISHWGVCSDTASTAAKTVTVSGFTLVSGAWVAVQFTNGNEASNPTLNINATGAAAIKYMNEAIDAGLITENGTYMFVYDGTAYQLVGSIGGGGGGTTLVATSARNGLMSKEDKATFDAISTTYATKSEVSLIPRFNISVVDALPTQDISTTTIYLVRNTETNSDCLYEEFIYVNNAWESLGPASVQGITNTIWNTVITPAS